MARARTTGSFFFRTMGLFWRAEDVFWGTHKNPGSLWGRRRGRGATKIDFRDQTAIYALYADYSLVYVGQTGGRTQRLLQRLRNHLSDDLAGRWNRFSWFGVRRVLRRGVLSKDNEAFHPSKETALNHVEGILIAAAAPPLNGQKGRFGRSVVKFEQKRDYRLGKTDRELLKEIRSEVETLRKDRRPGVS